MNLKLAINSIYGKFKRKTYFHVGIAKNHFEYDLDKFSFYKNPTNSYFADPFILQKNNQTYIFCERFDLKTGKGRIEILGINTNNELFNLGIAIEREYHLSFPFILEYKEVSYMVPESKPTTNITLYRNQVWPNRWQQIAILVDGVAAVDSIVFLHNDIWWLITTIDSAGVGMPQAELHVYYSRELHLNNWKKHSKNPVLVDSNKGRNAGFIRDGEKIIRCSQAYINHKYGSKVSFHEIISLSEDNYVEVDLDLQINNAHTFDTKHGFSVLDARF